MITTADLTAVDYQDLTTDERAEFKAFIAENGADYDSLADAYVDFLATR